MAGLGGYLRLLRWPGALTAAANCATGFLLTREVLGPGEWGAAIGIVSAGALVYLGGVVLNDVADSDRDRDLHPERPLPSGTVPRRSAAALGVAFLVVGCVLSLVTAGLPAATATCAAAVAALIYDFGAKRWRYPGALAMGAARGANALAGCLAAAGSLDLFEQAASTSTLAYPIGVAGYALLLTFTSTFEDRHPSAVLAGSLAVALVLPAALAWPHFRAAWWWAPALPLVLLAGSLVAGAREAQIEDGPGIGAIVRRGVFGFLLVDSAWLMGASWYDAGFWLLLVYVALRFVLARARS